jgi:hypothetical protein
MQRGSGYPRRLNFALPGASNRQSCGDSEQRMKAILAACLATGSAAAQEPAPNPLIDYGQFQRIVTASHAQHESRRLSEDEFLARMHEAGVVVLDARTESRFRLRHVRGAVNLPFTEFTAQSLARIAPDKATPILIYCNNNFLDSPAAFATKAPAASLNLSTFTSLKAYGYTNVYELGPLLRVDATKIPFEGSEVD